MFVQATENEEMKKEIQQCAERNKMKLKIIEIVESNIRKELQRSNPFKSKTCGNVKCKICELETGVNCRARGCIYEMHCKLCDRKYRGQTGNSAQEKINQHFNDWSRKLDTCPLYRQTFTSIPSRRFFPGWSKDTTELFRRSNGSSYIWSCLDRWTLSRRNNECEDWVDLYPAQQIIDALRLHLTSDNIYRRHIKETMTERRI